MAGVSGCKVYSSSLLDELVSSCKDDPAPTGARGKGRGRRNGGKQGPGNQLAEKIEAKKVLRNRAYWARMNKVQEESERKVRDRLENSRIRKEKRFDEMYDSILQGEERNRWIDSKLAFYDQMERRKAMARYNDWHENVYSKIKASVAAKAEKNAKKMRVVRAREYEKFLQETNEKDSLFLDIVIASSYDPFVVNRNAIRCDVGVLDDPTKRVLAKHEAEQNMIPRLDKEVPPPTRGALPVEMWASGKIESTPHAHFSSSSNHSNRSGTAVGSTMYASKIMFDHFTAPRGREPTDAEFPRGKRTDFSHLTPPRGAAVAHETSLID